MCSLRFSRRGLDGTFLYYSEASFLPKNDSAGYLSEVADPRRPKPTFIYIKITFLIISVETDGVFMRLATVLLLQE